jgi:hypothetical protein
MGSSFLDVFFGSAQSNISAYAILAAIIAICITILLTRTDMTMGNRFLLIFFVILTLVPSIFLTLFQITCMVTGGNSKERWWCWAYAWIIAAFIIIYCILIIVISFASLFTYNGAIDKVEVHELNNKMSQENSNQYAKTIIETNNEVEKFANEYKQAQQQSSQPSTPTPTQTLPASTQAPPQRHEQKRERDETHNQSSCPPCPACPTHCSSKPNPSILHSSEVKSSSHSDLEPFTNSDYALF